MKNSSLKQFGWKLFLSFIFALSSIAAISAQQLPDADLERGKEFFIAGNYAAAVESFSKCVDSAEATIKSGCLLMRGRAYRRSGSKEKAAADFRAFLKLNPADIKASGYLKNIELTVDELGNQAEALANAGKPAEVLDLVLDYPEYADETNVLYFKSVSYTELKDFKTADIYYQKQFDPFVKNGLESLKAAEESLGEGKEDIALLMYSTALISFGSAELVNSLRAVATEKNGLPKIQRNPKNLPGYDEFLKAYEKTSVSTADLNAKHNETGEALENYGKAIKMNPKNRAAYLGRAKVYRKLRKIKLAQADELKAKAVY